MTHMFVKKTSDGQRNPVFSALKLIDLITIWCYCCFICVYMLFGDPSPQFQFFWARRISLGPVATLFMEKEPLKVYNCPMSPVIMFTNHIEAKIRQMAFCTFVHS